MLSKRSDIIYKSTKTWAHVCSTAFRQPLADSHCHDFHGYGLTFKVVFAAYELDHRNWVIDFGELKPAKKWLEDSFDHKLIVSEDDPNRNMLEVLDKTVASVVIVPATGCEALARMFFDWMEQWLADNGHAPRVWLESVEVSEHEANSALVVRR